MKILHLDIETAPNLGHIWSLWGANVYPSQLIQSGYILCWAAKWDRSKEMHFERISHSEPGKVSKADKRQMLQGIHDLLDEADVVVTYNGMKFDIPTLNGEFLEEGFKPPSPYRQVDMYRVVKKLFRFPSYRLDYVCERLGIGKKASTGGHELWVRCMNEEDKGWAKMERYNRADVRRLQEPLYHYLIPWIPNHPNHALYQDGERPVCPNCGKDRLRSKGYRTTYAQKYRRYQCQACGAWSRDNVKRAPPVKRRPAKTAIKRRRTRA